MWSNREKSFISAAKTLARRSQCPNRHGCIIARRNKILALGWNKEKTHPAAKRYKSKCIHAELACIIQVNSDDLRGADLYVARIMRGKIEKAGLSRPCKECLRLIKIAGIKRVYYTTSDSTIEMMKI